MPFGSIQLNDGTKIPAIAFGTGSTLKGQDVTEYVEQAIEHGFSHIDTAACEFMAGHVCLSGGTPDKKYEDYKTETYVGKAIREEGLKRSELYITTKWGGGSIQKSIDNSLNEMGIKQVDLYLIHNPGFIEGPMEDTWRIFEKLREDGLTKSIGVSNFNLKQLQELVKVAKVKPAVNQIFFNPYNWIQIKELVEFSASQGIVTEAYSSLAPITRYPGGPVDPVLKTIGLRLGATPAQVIFSWVKSKGAVIVTTTTKADRLEEYLAVADLPELTAAEIAAIEAAGVNGPPSITLNKGESSNVLERLLLICIALSVSAYVGVHYFA